MSSIVYEIKFKNNNQLSFFCNHKNEKTANLIIPRLLFTLLIIPTGIITILKNTHGYHFHFQEYPRLLFILILPRLIIIFSFLLFIDTVEEIIDYIDAQFPTKNRINDATLNESVDKLTRNFFSKFCFYIKSVSKDSSALVSELHRLDDLLRRTTTR